MNCKVCTKCNTEKPLEEFYFFPSKNRLAAKCKGCSSKIRRLRYANKKDHELAVNRVYAAAHKKEACEAVKKWNKENRASITAKENLRYKNDPQFRMRKILRTRLTNAMKRRGLSKTDSTFGLLSCPVPDFLVYIQSLFRPGMDWENQGVVWHMDHIKPIAAFDLTCSEQRKECFHWTNFQPLFAVENMQKSDYYEPSYQAIAGTCLLGRR